MYGKLRDDIREILRTLCKYKKVEIIEGGVSVDHVHLCIAIPPKLSISSFMGYLKGKSALMIFNKYPEMGDKRNREFWAKGYFVITFGYKNEETVKKYIQQQQEYSFKEDRAINLF